MQAKLIEQIISKHINGSALYKQRLLIHVLRHSCNVDGKPIALAEIAKITGHASHSGVRACLAKPVEADDVDKILTILEEQE